MRLNPSRAGDSSPKSSAAAIAAAVEVQGEKEEAGLAVRREERRPSRGKEDILEGEPPGVLLYFHSILYFHVASVSFTLHGVEPHFVDVFTVGAPSAVGEPPKPSQLLWHPAFEQWVHVDPWELVIASRHRASR
jgi:hypothetical protein